MKLILTGSTGSVGAECIRLALKNRRVTNVVALARRPITISEQSVSAEERAKFNLIVIDDFGKDYSDSVKRSMKGADACIWNLALTLNQRGRVSPEEAKKVCCDYTLLGLRNMSQVANASHPFRFIYTSSAMSEPDQDKPLWFRSWYRKMRGEFETLISEHGSSFSGRVQVQITRPGLIEDAERNPLVQTMLGSMLGSIGLPRLHVSEVAAAELDQAIKGFERRVLENDDLVRIGHEALKFYGNGDLEVLNASGPPVGVPKDAAMNVVR